MSTTDTSFESLRQAIQSLWPEGEFDHVALRTVPRMLLLTSPSDVAAFSVFDGHPDQEFDETYASFKTLYRQNNRDWDARTLSFVVCRSSRRRIHGSSLDATAIPPNCSLASAERPRWLSSATPVVAFSLSSRKRGNAKKAAVFCPPASRLLDGRCAATTDRHSPEHDPD